MHFDAHTCLLPRNIQALLAAGRSPAESAPAEGLPPQLPEVTGVRGFAFGALPMGSLATNGAAATAKPAGLNERAGGPDRQALARVAVQAGLNRPG